LGPKKIFAGLEAEDEYFVQVGGHKLNDTERGIRRGIKAFTGTEMESFFMPLADQILESVEEQMKGRPVKYVILVGGFGDSPYLRARFQSNPMFKGAEVILVNNSTAKAVAEGSVIWKIQHSVTARAVRFAYGIENNPLYEPKNPAHQGRKCLSSVNRGWIVKNVWHGFVKKGEIVKVDKCCRFENRLHHDSPNADLSKAVIAIWVSLIDDPTTAKHYFMTDINGRLRPGVKLACRIKADMSNAKDTLKKRNGEDGPRWTLDHDILLYFGRTELMAQMAWKDSKGKEHRSDAVVVPEKF
jgi:hypothetical protein